MGYGLERNTEEQGFRVRERVCACMNNRFYQASLDIMCVCTCMCVGPWRGECAL